MSLLRVGFESAENLCLKPADAGYKVSGELFCHLAITPPLPNPHLILDECPFMEVEQGELKILPVNLNVHVVVHTFNITGFCAAVSLKLSC